MKISIDEKLTDILEIAFGETFIFKREAYMRVDSEFFPNDVIIAVNLESGQIQRFLHNANVIRKALKVVSI